MKRGDLVLLKEEFRIKEKGYINKNKLINFNLFKEKSLFLSNSYSPSSHTLESIPSIFMSRDVKDIKYLNNKIYLKDNLQNKEINFSFSNTFLSDLGQNNFIFN